jgi:tetratricopeptide (TPR) repeat protein
MLVPLVGYWSSSRYRMGLLPLVVLWAAAAIVCAVDLVRERRTTELLRAAAWVAALAVAFNWPYDHFSRHHHFDAEMYGFAGLRLIRQGEPERGRLLLEQAVALDPGRVEFQSGLGYALVEGGRLDEGITHLRTAVTIEPGLAAVWNNLATAYAGRGDLEPAVQAFERSLSIDPDQALVRDNLRHLHELRAAPHR